MRDHASIQQLLVLANLESLNAELIEMGLPAGGAVAEAQRCRNPPNAIVVRQCGGAPDGKCTGGTQAARQMIAARVRTGRSEVIEVRVDRGGHFGKSIHDIECGGGLEDSRRDSRCDNQCTPMLAGSGASQRTVDLAALTK